MKKSNSLNFTKDPPVWIKSNQLQRTWSDCRRKSSKEEDLDESIFKENDPKKLSQLVAETLDILDLSDDVIQVQKMKRLLATNPPKLLLQLFIQNHPEIQRRKFHYDCESELAGLELLGDLTDLNIIESVCLLDLESVKWGQGNSLLHLASFMGMGQTCKLLIEWGVPWNVRNLRGYRPVDCADDDECRWVFWNLSACDVSVVTKGEIEDAIDVTDTTDTSEEEEQAPLDQVYQDGGQGATGREVVRRLVDQVIEEGALNPGWEVTPAKRAGAGIPPPLALPSKGAKQRKRVQFDDFTVFLQAAQNGELDTLEALISETNRDGISKLINCKSAYKKFSAMHLACMNNHISVVEFLLTMGAMPNEQDMYGYTPLHYAVLEGHAELTRFMIRRGEVTLKTRSLSGEAVWDCTDDSALLNVIHRECVRRAEMENEEAKRRQLESRRHNLSVEMANSQGSGNKEKEPVRKPIKSGESKPKSSLNLIGVDSGMTFERPSARPQGPKPFDPKPNGASKKELTRAGDKGVMDMERTNYSKNKVAAGQGIRVDQVQTHPRPLPSKPHWKTDLKLPTRKLSATAQGQAPAVGLVAQAKFNLMKRIGVEGANQRTLSSQRIPLN